MKKYILAFVIYALLFATIVYKKHETDLRVKALFDPMLPSKSQFVPRM